MANLKSIAISPVAITETVVYTVPASGVNSAKLAEVIFSNTSADTVNYTLSLTKSNGTKVQLIPATQLAGRECNQLIMSTFLQVGDSLSIVADKADTVNAIISYIEL